MQTENGAVGYINAAYEYGDINVVRDGIFMSDEAVTDGCLKYFDCIYLPKLHIINFKGGSENMIEEHIYDLVDIQDVEINHNQPKEQRIMQYINDIKDPYCFKVDDTVIRVEFSDTTLTLQDVLSNYIKSKILPK